MCTSYDLFKKQYASIWVFFVFPIVPVLFLPISMEGGFTASAESSWFDWIRDGKVNWKKALVNGILGVAIGFGAPYVMDGIGTGLQQIRHLPVAFEITPNGAILAKRLGDTGIGQKLQDAGDAIRRFARAGDEVATIPKLDSNAGQVREITKTYQRGPKKSETVVIKKTGKELGRQMGNLKKRDKKESRDYNGGWNKGNCAF